MSKYQEIRTLDIDVRIIKEDYSKFDGETFITEFLEFIEKKGMLCSGGFTYGEEESGSYTLSVCRRKRK